MFSWLNKSHKYVSLRWLVSGQSVLFMLTACLGSTNTVRLVISRDAHGGVEGCKGYKTEPPRIFFKNLLIKMQLITPHSLEMFYNVVDPHQ